MHQGGAPAMKDVIRVAAVGDTHVPRAGHAGLQPMLAAAAAAADVLVLCGDITDYGLPEEARIVATALQQTVRIPVVAVLGNHDFESGNADEVKKILVDVGVILFHGHAHRGSLEGRTREGAPVYNVAMPLLVQLFPGQPPVRIIELPTAMAAVA